MRKQISALTQRRGDKLFVIHKHNWVCVICWIIQGLIVLLNLTIVILIIRKIKEKKEEIIKISNCLNSCLCNYCDSNYCVCGYIN